MANKKISQLLSGGALLPTDRFPVARSGTNVSILGSTIFGPSLRAAFLSDVYGIAEGSTKIFDFADGKLPTAWRYPFGYFRSDNPSKYPTIVTTDTDTISGNLNVLQFPTMANDDWSRIDIDLPAGPAATVSFNYHINTEANGDYFRVYAGVIGSQTLLLAESGAQPWKTFTYTFTGSAATMLTIEYGKDYNITAANEFIRISNLSITTPVVTNPYRVGDLITHGGKNYVCRSAATTQEPGTGTDWLFIAGDLAPAVAALTTRINRVEGRPTGLPYAYAGLTKFRFFRLGILAHTDNRTYINEIRFRSTLDDADELPRVLVRDQVYPDAMFDGDMETGGFIDTFGQFRKITKLDFGTPTLIKYFQFATMYGGGHAFFVEASNDEEVWVEVFAGSAQTTAKVFTTATLLLPQFNGETGYNLTANPQTNIGGFMKVNKDGTGFDFAEAASGSDGAAGAAGPAGPKGDKGDTGSQGIQGIQGIQGPAGQNGTGTGTGGSSAALYQASNAKNLTGGGPTTITTLSFTARAGSKRSIYVAFFQGTVFQSGQSGTYRVVRHLYRNGTEIAIPRYSDEFIDDADLGANSVTYSVAYEYQLVQADGTVTQSYASTTPWEAYIKVVEH